MSDTVIVIQEETAVIEVSTPGVPGPTGEGVPAGGTTGQGLLKASDDDFDTEWSSAGGGGASELVDLDDVSGAPPAAGEAPVWDGDSFELTNVATQAELDALAATVATDAELAAHVAAADPHPGYRLESAAITGADIQDGTLAAGDLDFDPATQAELDALAAAAAAADAVVQGNLDDHIADPTAAHPATAVSIVDAAGDFTATEVEGALAELQTADEADEAALAAHIADGSAAHAASAISADSTTLVGTATDVQGVLEELDNGIADHLADTSDAHDASAVSVLDTAGDYTATDVEGVLAEIAPQLGGGSTDGWTDADETWTYASATTFTVTGDQTAKLSKGTRIKLTQTTVKYFVVVAVSYSDPTTTVTITGGADHTLANAAITDNFYSYAMNPQGYPGWFAHTPTFTGFSVNPSSLTSRFAVNGRVCTFQYGAGTQGTSNATSFTLTLPIVSVSDLTNGLVGVTRVFNNGAFAAGLGGISLPAASAIATMLRDGVGTAWTGSGAKGVWFVATYEI